MSEIGPCCRDLPGGPSSSSPFSRMVELDYYDGPVSGALQCRVCLATYRFEMLDWDDKQEVRIFSLAPLPQDAFAQVVREDAEFPKGSLPPEWDREAAYQKLKRLLDEAGPVELVIAWRRSDGKVLTARRVGEAERGDIRSGAPWEADRPSRDWFGFLGLAR
jgi:hypothetical protein